MPALTSHSHSTQPRPVTLSSMQTICSALTVSYLSPPLSFFSPSSLFFSAPTSHKRTRSDAGKIGHVGRKCCSSGLGSFSSSLSVSQFKVVRCMSAWDVREGGTQWHSLMEALKHINHPCLCDQANVWSPNDPHWSKQTHSDKEIERSWPLGTSQWVQAGRSRRYPVYENRKTGLLHP